MVINLKRFIKHQKIHIFLHKVIISHIMNALSFIKKHY